MNVFNPFKFVIQIDQVGCSILLSYFLSILSELNKLLLHLSYLLSVIVCINLLFSISDTDSRENICVPTKLLLWLGQIRTISSKCFLITTSTLRPCPFLCAYFFDWRRRSINFLCFLFFRAICWFFHG